MASKRGSQRGVIRVASALLLSGFGALMSLTGCSTEEVSKPESVGSQQESLVMCGLANCQDDCSAYTCLGNTCVQGKPSKAMLAACTSGAKGTPSGRCGWMDDKLTEWGCCANGCLTQVARDVWQCIPFVNQDAKTCEKGGAACTDCQPANCGDPSGCKLGTCTYTPVPDDTTCLDKTGVCFGGNCCAGCIDANGNCQTGDLTAQCGVSTPGGKHADCQNCVDTDACTTDLCKGGSCAHGASPDNTPCLDANKCDGAESCQGGVCKDEPNFKCPSDNNVCHAPSCDQNNGCGQTLLTGTNCPDANLCNGTEKCNNGVCNGVGTPLNCNDNKPCTVDDCDPSTGCTHAKLAPGEDCDDGNVCNGVGMCDANGNCTIVPSKTCDDGDPCTDDSCDPVKGCITTFNKADCNDGDPCTTVDACNGAGKCVGSVPPKCDDGNECTTDTCVKFVGCQSTAGNEGGNCDDGNACSTGDKCVSGKCKSTGGTVCPDDTNPCTVASCDPSNGNACGQTNDPNAKCQVDKCHQLTQCNANGTCPDSALIDCADTNPCTKDTCDAQLGCQHTPDDKATCNDGDLCTTGDACVNGECVTKDVVCKPLGACYTAGTCNPKTGLCDAPRVDPGTDCSNATGKCDDNGVCVPNPTNEGGAGGAGAGGDGTGPTPEGGAPTTVGSGGEGNEPVTSGGETATGTGGNAGKGGSKATAGSSTTTEGGAPEIPEHVFVRDPGGCSCSVPASPSGQGWAGLAALAVAVGVVARGRRRRQAGQRHVSL